MAQLSGADILARTLKAQGITEVFELPGDPIGTMLNSCTAEGIRCFTFRHEQAAAMAAQAWSWTTRTPGVSIVASGPAMVNAVTGLYTAWANCWPFILIGGNSISTLRGLGDFQETPQVEAAAPFTKWSVSVSGPERIPYYVNRALHLAMEGRPGPVYLDFPADVITGSIDEDLVEMLPAATRQPPARPLADPALVERALDTIERAERPLLIIGKGAAWSDAAGETRRLVERLGIPFVPSPTGKGVVPDDHPLCVAAARSYALSHADTIVLLGARLNWIFHFGRPPRFAPDVKVIQIDIEPGEIGNSIPAAVGLVGDAKAVVRQLLDAGGETPLGIESWLQALRDEKHKNEEAVAAQQASDEAPMNFYRLFRDIADVIDKDAFVVADGESTAAISRAMLPTFSSRHRLDAGVSGCMGVAVPYAIGVQVAHPDKQVLCVTGDYALGWNLTDVETAVRYDLPIVFLVANNRSIGIRGGRSRYMQGLRPEADDCIRYEQIFEAFGGRGQFVATPGELRPALERAFSERQPVLLNVAVDPGAARKEQPFPWLARLGRMQY
jgi:2-hydroxyacyl-CoA lyase 1